MNNHDCSALVPAPALAPSRKTAEPASVVRHAETAAMIGRQATPAVKAARAPVDIAAAGKVARECDMGRALSETPCPPAKLQRTAMIIPLDVALSLCAATVFFAFVVALAAD